MPHRCLLRHYGHDEREKHKMVEIRIARSALDELLEISAINSDENEKVKSVLAACAYKNLSCLINNIVEVGELIYNFGSSK